MIAAGGSRAVRITVDASGKRLLAARHQLRVDLTVAQGLHEILSHDLTLRPPSRPSTGGSGLI
jgi:hypothetical protein